MDFLLASPAGAGFYPTVVLNILATGPFFRRSGVGFLTFAPIWWAGRYLYPAGVTLWVSSSTFMLVGIGLLSYQASAAV
jgi:hypothetical protein